MGAFKGVEKANQASGKTLRRIEVICTKEN